MKLHQDLETLTDLEVCLRIETLTAGMMSFWKNARGWAPDTSAALLSKSMLEWQVSLSSSLSRWLNATSPGDLILAWVNLGALVEGQLKLFLSVWLDDYKLSATSGGRNLRLMPDGLSLHPLRTFSAEHIWSDGESWDPYVGLVQERRNAIHAYKSRVIGTLDEWRSQLRHHLSFIRDINGRLPYPDDLYVPREV